MKTIYPSFAPARSRHAHDERRHALVHHIENCQEQIQNLVRQNQKTDAGLAARARSLLLFQRGASMDEITRVTQLSQNTILRVRRRFEHWGVACIAEPQPLPCKRTSPLHR